MACGNVCYTSALRPVAGRALPEEAPEDQVNAEYKSQAEEVRAGFLPWAAAGSHLLPGVCNAELLLLLAGRGLHAQSGSEETCLQLLGLCKSALPQCSCGSLNGTPLHAQLHFHRLLCPPFHAHTKQVLSQLEAVLREAGSGKEHLLSVTVLLKDLVSQGPQHGCLPACATFCGCSAVALAAGTELVRQRQGAAPGVLEPVLHPSLPTFLDPLSLSCSLRGGRGLPKPGTRGCRGAPFPP